MPTAATRSAREIAALARNSPGEQSAIRTKRLRVSQSGRWLRGCVSGTAVDGRGSINRATRNVCVVKLDNLSWPIRGPNVDWTIGSTKRRRVDLRTENACKRACLEAFVADRRLLEPACPPEVAGSSPVAPASRSACILARPGRGGESPSPSPRQSRPSRQAR